MKYRGLGPLSVSRFGLGTLTWGTLIDARLAGKLFGTFLDGGGTLIDTAAAYGAGDAERIVGRLVAGIGRDRVILASKAGVGLVSGRQVVDTSRTALLRDLEGSLKRLGTDHLDVWQVHTWGEAALSESLAALDDAVSSGKVRAVGVSNFVGWQTAQAVTWQAAVAGRTALACVQVEYSLLARRAELEVLPAVAEYGLACLAWAPLGRGVLSGQYLSRTPRGSRADHGALSWFVEPYLNEGAERIVRGVALAAEGFGLTPAQVAWLWVRDAPGVTAALAGARTVEQVSQFLDVEDIELPSEIAVALDDISGGPIAARLVQ